MREYVNDTIYNALPTTLKNAIIDTTVVSGRGSGDSSNFTSTDKLYFLSAKEVYNGGSDYDTAESERRQLDYYVDGESSIKKNGSLAMSWWLRTALPIRNYRFLHIHYNGAAFQHTEANADSGVSPAFRIG